MGTTKIFKKNTFAADMLTIKNNGTIAFGMWKLGTWSVVDVWAKNGGKKYNASGCRLVHYLYEIEFNGRKVSTYTKNEIREAVANWNKVERIKGTAE